MAILIFYGIYRIRDSFLGIVAGAVGHALGLGSLSLVVLALTTAVLVSLSLRIKYILHLLGSRIGLWDILKAYAISLTAIFSMVKFSDSVRAYYFSRKGVPLTYGLTSYVGERFFDILFLLPLGAVLLGEYSTQALTGLAIFSVFVLLLIRFTHRIPNIRFIRFFRDFGEDLRNMITPVSLFWLTAVTLVIFGMNTAAIAVATGTGPVAALKAFVLGCLVLGTSPTPAGIGVYEIVVPAYLTSLGVQSSAALGGILVYRFFILWLPSFIGIGFLHREL